MALDNKLQRIFNLICKIIAIVLFKSDLQVSIDDLLRRLQEGMDGASAKTSGKSQLPLYAPNVHMWKSCDCHWFECMLKNGWLVAAVQFKSITRQSFSGKADQLVSRITCQLSSWRSSLWPITSSPMYLHMLHLEVPNSIVIIVGHGELMLGWYFQNRHGYQVSEFLK